MMVNSKKLKNKIIGDFEKLEIIDFIEYLQQYGDVILCGGYLREIYLDWNNASRDIDIILYNQKHSVKMIDIILNYFGSVAYQAVWKENRYGGVKLNINKVEIDVWLHSDSFFFKDGYPQLNSWEELEETPFSNFDALFFNLTKNELMDYHFQDLLKNKKVKLLNPISKDLPLACIKLLIKEIKYKQIVGNVSYCSKLKTIFNDLTDADIDYMYHSQLKIYNKEYFAKQQIKEKINEIINREAE